MVNYIQNLKPCSQESKRLCDVSYNFTITSLTTMVFIYNSWDWFKIVGFSRISRYIKQPCKTVCLKKALKCIKLA